MYWITAILGATLVLSPFIFGYSANTTALWASLVIGVGVVIASYIEYVAKGKDVREYWVVAIAGILAVLAPFVLNFGHINSAFWMTVLVGLLLTGLGFWEVGEKRKI